MASDSSADDTCDGMPYKSLQMDTSYWHIHRNCDSASSHFSTFTANGDRRSTCQHCPFCHMDSKSQLTSTRTAIANTAFSQSVYPQSIR